MTPPPTVGALFAGYEGIGLAVEEVFGALPAWFSEFEKAPSKILAAHYPDVPNLGDITKIKWSPDCPRCGAFTRVRRSPGALRVPVGYTCSSCGREHGLSLRQRQMRALGIEIASPVDLITGGSPCQDLSHAGKRAGLKAGTRSGLWASMCDAIDIIRPSLVVWENVRGALSAEASAGDLESCEFCVGDAGGTHLRALGRVLGDLAELGYDAAWCSLRAADVGAPHGRYRVFVLAWPAADADDDGRGQQLTRGLAAAQPGPEDPARDAPDPLVVGRRAQRVDGLRPEGLGGREAPLRRGLNWGSPEWRELALLKTPTSQLAVNGGSQHPNKRKAGGHGPTLADEVEHLLPTPVVNDMGAGKSPDAWDAWTERLKKSSGNGNGHGASLSIEALRMLPTPQAADGSGAMADRRAISGYGPALRDVSALMPTPTTAPTTGNGHARNLGAEAKLMPTPSVADATGGHATRSGARSDELLLPGLVKTLIPTPRATRGGSGTETMYGLGAERSDDDRPQGQVLLPTPTASDSNSSGGAVGTSNVTLTDATTRADSRGIDFGAYGPAVERWERVLGRAAPSPTEPTGKGGAERLSPRFVEWMMGLPAGWVTGESVAQWRARLAARHAGSDIAPVGMRGSLARRQIGISRNEELKALGNGVVPQQAAAAIRYLLQVAADRPSAAAA